MSIPVKFTCVYKLKIKVLLIKLMKKEKNSNL